MTDPLPICETPPWPGSNPEQDAIVDAATADLRTQLRAALEARDAAEVETMRLLPGGDLAAALEAAPEQR